MNIVMFEDMAISLEELFTCYSMICYMITMTRFRWPESIPVLLIGFL